MTWMVRIWVGSEMSTPARGVSEADALRCALHHLSLSAALFGRRADAALIADTASSAVLYLYVTRE